MNTSKFATIAQAVIRISTIFALIAGFAVNVSQASAQDPATFDCSNVTGIPVAECEALVALYNNTNGANWADNTGWLQTNTPCSWYGVSCSGANVTYLDLGSNQLGGSIPIEIGNLANLTHLNLSGDYMDLVWNQLSGSIPPELGNLRNLTYLDLGGNRLSGSIPPELGNLINLTHLDLNGNQLSGSIPPELGNLANLTILSLAANITLSGSIPQELGRLTNLRELYLSSNQLTGSIPPELGNLTNLRIMYFIANDLSGSIPPELGNLTQLYNLDLAANQLSGPIPTDLGRLTNLGVLNLERNQLSGSIPAEIGNLTKITNLYLGSNQLTGSIPTELGNLINLVGLHLPWNQLSGSIPPELGNLTKLRWLELNGNQLSGSIPTWLGILSNLLELSLGSNQLTGSIPAEIGNLTNLTLLDLSGNQLNSSIPTQLGNLANLAQLDLSGNQFSGSIPTELGNLINLGELSLNGNQLSGEFPASITNLVNLYSFTFDCGITSSDPAVITFIENIVPGWQNLCAPVIWYTTPNNGPVSGGTIVTISGELFTDASSVTFGGTEAASFTVDFDGQITAVTPAHAGGTVDITVTSPKGVGTGTGAFVYSSPFTGCAAVSQISQPECEALVTLYNSTDGANWTYNSGWLQTDTPCAWYGVYCSGTNVYFLILYDNHLSGSIPPELGNLTQLWYVDLGSNQLTGSIPSELGNLTLLGGLSLSGNQLTGSIPPQLGTLTQLLYLDLSANQLTGSIPPELGNLSNLWLLHLGDNQMSGEIPVSFTNLTGLGNLTGFGDLTLSCGLYSSDPAVISFIENIVPGWQDNICWDMGTYTPAGNDVSVTPEPWLEINFSVVGQEGYTTIQTYPDPVNMPDGFQLLGSGYDITTTSQFDQAQVCFAYDDTGLSSFQEEAILLFHFENNAWVDVTDAGYPDTTNNVVCGTVTSFSPFAILYTLNQPPQITSFTTPLDPQQVGQTVTATVTFNDPDSGDTHTALWDWGDGEISSTLASLPSASTSHIYAVPGVYTVTVTIADAAGESDTETVQYVVIYDPNGGFVTGGGWINSPAGAYTPDPTLTGKATFGFVSKYEKGANVPTGNTEFQFKVGNLNFKSTSYEWLVVAGSKAQFKGQGTINDQGEYGFMLTAIDGSPDKFRIKIWDKATGNIVYDNMLDAPDDVLPATVLGGGSIVVHK